MINFLQFNVMYKFFVYLVDNGISYKFANDTNTT